MQCNRFGSGFRGGEDLTGMREHAHDQMRRLHGHRAVLRGRQKCGDGEVRFHDFVILADNFGHGTTQAVPEPSGWFIVFCLLLASKPLSKSARPNCYP